MEKELIENIKNDKFAAYVGITLLEISPGYALAQLAVSEKHLNGVNIVQGGALFALADYAFAAACNSHGNMTVGVNVNMSYFKTPRGKTIIAEATELKSSKHLCWYNVDVFDDDKELIAKFIGTGKIKR